MNPTTAPTPGESRAIAKDAYVYGYPKVDGYRIQHLLRGSHESTAQALREADVAVGPVLRMGPNS
jgi:hypothetical protein